MKEPIHKIGRIFSWIDKQLFWSSQFNTFLIEVNIYKEIKVKKLHIPSLNIQQLPNIDSHNLRIAIYVNVKLLQFQTYFFSLDYSSFFTVSQTTSMKMLILVDCKAT